MCIECWTKLSDFDDFYNAVDEAKHSYLARSVKEEFVLCFDEINCPAVEPNDDVVFAKVELLDDVVAADADHNDDEFKDKENFRNDNDTRSNDAHEDGSSVKSVIEFSEKYDLKVEAMTESEANVENTPATPETPVQKDKVKKYDHLILQYMNMYCERCRHPFATLSDACRHYRSKHNERTVKLNCCDRKFAFSDVRSHMRYHMNPDIWK